MRIRRRRAPWILLPILLPHLVASTVIDGAKGKAGSVEQLANNPDVAGPAPLITNPKPDKGTKDAPVDGLDGKPKLGPFVDSGSGKKKPQTVEDIGTPSNSKSTVADSDARLDTEGASESEREQHRMLMEAQGNVMDDPHREAPKEGTTGTEGGISEKERLRKAQESRNDAEPVEKKPEMPKEVPELPQSEEARIGKDKAIKMGKDDEKPKGAQGMEVCSFTRFSTFKPV